MFQALKLMRQKIGGHGTRSRWLLCLMLGAWAATASSARAYDLSRAYESAAPEAERGFVVGSVGLWIPGLGSFQDYHQLSLEYAGELGIRILSIRGEHNVYVVGGFNLSPQKLDSEWVRDASRRSTTMLLGYAGVRYLPSALCIGDGLGCPFVELRFGLLFENADERAHPNAPNAELTVLPGIGYRFSVGQVFQLGARADLSWTEEDYSRELGWLSVTGFIGFGW
jgi:hypothetical protein